MILKAKQLHHSEAIPGISYNVRSLSMIRRAERDAPIADKRLEYTRLINEQQSLTDKHMGQLNGQSGAERVKLIQALPDDIRSRLIEVSHLADCIHKQFIMPAAIRAGLIEVLGYENEDGTPVTVDHILESAPDTLLEEIYVKCEAGAGLTGEEQKN